jgi:hypothetical protein
VIASPVAVTAIKLISAMPLLQGAMLEWETGYEATTLGYNIYRERSASTCDQVSLAGSALMVAAGTNLTSEKSLLVLGCDR